MIKIILAFLFSINICFGSFDPAISLQGDNVYSAQLVGSGLAITSQNKAGWITGSATNPGTGIYLIPVASGIFSLVPNCSVVSTIVGGIDSTIVTYDVLNSTTTSLKFHSRNSANGNLLALGVAVGVSFQCQKQGADYVSSSSAVYATQNANYDWTTYAATVTSIGTSPTMNCKHRRVGGDLEMNCSGLTGTSPPASIGSITLPNSLAIDTTKITINSANGSVGQVFGQWTINGSNSLVGAMIANTSTSANVLYFGNTSTATLTTLVATNSNAIFPAGVALDIKIKVPILGWSNVSTIVGSFSGYGQVPGIAATVNPNVDHLSFSMGGSSVTSICSASPCWLDQLGQTAGTSAQATGVSQITRQSVGNYTIVLNRTYTKIRCTANAALLAIGQSPYVSPIRGEAVSSIAFTINRADTAAAIDNYAEILCTGNY